MRNKTGNSRPDPRYDGTVTTLTVTASAPTRICDCGGWTDTWFARYGAVFHIAVEPRVFVSVRARPRQDGAPRVTIEAASYGERYTVRPGTRPFGAHPLIEAAVESIGVPDGVDLSVSVRSDMPPGASTGTSGAVCVAVVGAMRRLGGLAHDPLDVARAAHVVETDVLGQQSGVQDQVAAACGGINFVDVPAYPRVAVTALRPSGTWVEELQARLMLVYLGRGHHSSTVHEQVIRDVAGAGAGHPALAALRQAAVDARDAVLNEDLRALGSAMTACTTAQQRLHAELIGADATRVIAAARACGALGWKVNGAGGEGGSVTLLAADGGASHARLDTAVRGLSPAFRVIPVRISHRGLVFDEPEPPV